MPTRSQKAASVFGVIFGLLVLVYPFVSSMAQTTSDQKTDKAQKQEDALKIVRENLVANIFYDALQAQERDWVLIKAHYSSGPPVEEWIPAHFDWSVSLYLKKDRAEARIYIYEYATQEAAKSPFTLAISQGFFKKCDGECGDEGERVYGGDGRFSALRFRKGRFFVSINCDSEEIAKRFAGYAVNSIGAR